MLSGRACSQEFGTTRDRIIRATNSQTQLPAGALRATESIQKDVEESVAHSGSYYYERRASYYRNLGFPLDQVVSMARLAHEFTAFVTALDDHSRLAYTEDLPDETAPTCAAFLTRATAWFAERGVTIERVLTDNAWAYTKNTWRQTCRDLGISPAGPGPGGRRQTARSNASTAPCSTNGPTPGPTPQTPNGRERFPAGWTGTTTTDPTPESAATPQPAASPTSPDNTSRACRLDHGGLAGSGTHSPTPERRGGTPIRVVVTRRRSASTPSSALRSRSASGGSCGAETEGAQRAECTRPRSLIHPDPNNTP